MDLSNLKNILTECISQFYVRHVQENISKFGCMLSVVI